MQATWDLFCQAELLERFVYLLVLHNHASGVMFHIVAEQFTVARKFAV